MPIPASFVTDYLPTNQGDLAMTFLGHGSLLFHFNDQAIYIDPYAKVADYSKLPPAHLVLITHHHRDHLDPDALQHILTSQTEVVGSPLAIKSLKRGQVLRNGEECSRLGVHIRAVPAYNLVHTLASGRPYHPKGEDNGYVLTFGDQRVYIGGDTENIPEMDHLGPIDVAFLPMNLPYTMTPEMVAEAAGRVRPGILYPYHFGDTDTARLTDLLAGQPETEVRIRPLA